MFSPLICIGHTDEGFIADLIEKEKEKHAQQMEDRYMSLQASIVNAIEEIYMEGDHLPLLKDIKARLDDRFTYITTKSIGSMRMNLD